MKRFLEGEGGREEEHPRALGASRGCYSSCGGKCRLSLLSEKREVPAHLWPLQGLICFDSPSADSLCCVVLRSTLGGQGAPPRGSCPWGHVGLRTHGSRGTFLSFLVPASPCEASEVTFGPQGAFGLVSHPQPLCTPRKCWPRPVYLFIFEELNVVK